MKPPRKCDERLAEKLLKEAFRYQLAEVKQRVGSAMEEFSETRIIQIEHRASALERLAKCYSGLVQGEYHDVHDPMFIFQKLHEVWQIELALITDCGDVQKSRATLLSMLEQCSNSYPDARYHYEKDRLPNDNAIDFLCDVFLAAIYGRRPHWKVHEDVLWNTKEALGFAPRTRKPPAPD